VLRGSDSVHCQLKLGSDPDQLVRPTVELTGGAHATFRGEQPRRGNSFEAYTDTVRCSVLLCRD